jgi:hypothetical protein
MMKFSKSVSRTAAVLLLGVSSAGLAGIFAESDVKFEKVASDTVSIHATQLFETKEGAEVTGYVNLANPVALQHGLGYMAIKVMNAEGKAVEQGYAVLRPSSISKLSQSRFEGYLSKMPDKDATISLSYVE